MQACLQPQLTLIPAWGRIASDYQRINLIASLSMAIITLTTDFGSADGYVGAMKGVILGIAPAVQLVDLSHEIAAQDVRGAEHVLRGAAAFFPAGTVHLAVIDPDVGSRRRPLLITTPRASFVGPDNGLFTFALAEAGAAAFELDRPEFWLPSISRTFHGRDIFAPAAAHVACGVAPHALGSPVSDPVHLPTVAPQRCADGHIVGHAIHVDRFGNLITDIPGGWGEDGLWRLEIAGRQITRFGAIYADAAVGELLILVGSAGTLEIAARDGNAAALLGVGVGEVINLRPAV
jgi:S-adenosyl-L-methionine hydrolase (adenosine-forming)